MGGKQKAEGKKLARATFSVTGNKKAKGYHQTAHSTQLYLRQPRTANFKLETISKKLETNPNREAQEFHS